MYNFYEILLVCIGAMIVTLLITPILKPFVKTITTQSIDYINGHITKTTKTIPTMGGIAIFVTFFSAIYFFTPIPNTLIHPIFASSLIVLITGIIDDAFAIKPLSKSIGIILGATTLFFFSDISFQMTTLPFLGALNIAPISYILTVVWLLGFSNSMNLIDGLDGLASGVSIIALTTMGVTGFFFLTIEKVSISVMIFILVACIIGFWPYNFFPASIFLGDTGALFLGFMIGTFALEGLRNASFIALVLPIVILGIPFTDTFYAIVRRKLDRLSFKSRDLGHIHYRLIFLGMTHRSAVISIYLLSSIFSIVALILNFSSFLGATLLIVCILISIELFVEVIELMGSNRKPLLIALKWLYNQFNT